MTVPDEVRAAIDGRPTIGEWDVMLPLLTVDDSGFPHVCLLSRAELDADAEQVYAVLASPTTIGNVRRDGMATLVVVDKDAAVYCKLRASGVTESTEDGDWLAVTFAVASVKRDGIGVPLRPPEYLVTESVQVDENWARSAKLLDELKGA